jgi:hypothetical protein
MNGFSGFQGLGAGASFHAQKGAGYVVRNKYGQTTATNNPRLYGSVVHPSIPTQGPGAHPLARWKPKVDSSWMPGAGQPVPASTSATTPDASQQAAQPVTQLPAVPPTDWKKPAMIAGGIVATGLLGYILYHAFKSKKKG